MARSIDLVNTKARERTRDSLHLDDDRASSRAARRLLLNSESMHRPDHWLVRPACWPVAIGAGCNCDVPTEPWFDDESPVSVRPDRARLTAAKPCAARRALVQGIRPGKNSIPRATQRSILARSQLALFGSPTARFDLPRGTSCATDASSEKCAGPSTELRPALPHSRSTAAVSAAGFGYRPSGTSSTNAPVRLGRTLQTMPVPPKKIRASSRASAGRENRGMLPMGRRLRQLQCDLLVGAWYAARAFSKFS